MLNLILQLTEELEVKLTEHARREGRAPPEIAQEAIAEFLARKERERFVAAFVVEARTAYSDPAIRRGAIAVAEEALLTDNDDLSVAG